MCMGGERGRVRMSDKCTMEKLIALKENTTVLRTVIANGTKGGNNRRKEKREEEEEK